MRIAPLLLLLLLLAATRAQAGDNELVLGGHVRALRSESANALTQHSLGGGQLGYGRDLHLEVMPKLSLWAIATVTPTTTTGAMFQTLTTELSSVGLTAGVRARYDLHRYVQVHARLDAGAARVAVSIEDAIGHSARDTGWGGLTTAALGVDLLATGGRRFAIGLRAELGYVLASAVDLTALSERPDDGAIELPMVAAPLGELDLGGRYFSFALVGQF